MIRFKVETPINERTSEVCQMANGRIFEEIAKAGVPHFGPKKGVKGCLCRIRPVCSWKVGKRSCPTAASNAVVVAEAKEPILYCTKHAKNASKHVGSHLGPSFIFYRSANLTIQDRTGTEITVRMNVVDRRAG